MQIIKLLRFFPVAFGIALISSATVLAAPTEGQVFGSWSVNCEQASDTSQSGCFIVQNLVLREGGQRVMQFAVGFVEQAPQPIALLSLPLGISLPPGAEIRIDDKELTRVPIERCEPNGCRAGLKLDAEKLRALQLGKELAVTFYDAKRKPIVVPLSLDGFDDGLSALRPTDS